MPAVTKNQQAIARAGLTGLNATTGFTVAFWARQNYSQLVYLAQGNVFAQYNASTQRNGYAVGFQVDGTLTTVIHGSAGFTTSSIAGNSLSRSGQWAHYVVTFDDASDTVLGYVNGKLLGRVTNTRDLTSTATSLTTQIGGSITSLTEWRGSLFDIQVFPDVVITQDDIRHLMNPFESLPGLRGRYFGAQSVQYGTGVGGVRDESGSGNDLTATGAVPTEAEPPFRFTIA